MTFTFLFDFGPCPAFTTLPAYDQYRLIQSAAVNECRARKIIESDADMIVGTELQATVPDLDNPYMIPITVKLPMSVRHGGYNDGRGNGQEQIVGNDGGDVLVSHYIPGSRKRYSKKRQRSYTFDWFADI